MIFIIVRYISYTWVWNGFLPSGVECHTRTRLLISSMSILFFFLFNKVGPTMCHTHQRICFNNNTLSFSPGLVIYICFFFNDWRCIFPLWNWPLQSKVWQNSAYFQCCFSSTCGRHCNILVYPMDLSKQKIEDSVQLVNKHLVLYH